LNEDDAREWIAQTLNVSRETMDRLAAFAAMVAAEQATQNLVSAATIPHFWSRHIVDSAQLLPLVETSAQASQASWLDIGSGAGLPGVIVAIIAGAPVTLVEPRPLRADFLTRVASALDLANVTVVASPLSRMIPSCFGIVTARAVAALPKLIAMVIPFTDLSTVWVLPKGKSARAELESLPATWQGQWTTQASVTDPESHILIGRRIRMKGKA
jgi:16S rRNA (guanine527-N7)-methyltransferase